MSTARPISVAFRIASGCKKYEDDEEEEDDDDDDEWGVVKELSHQSINQVAEERGDEKTKATTKASRQKEVPLCVASRMDGWIDGQTDDDDCG